MNSHALFQVDPFHLAHPSLAPHAPAHDHYPHTNTEDCAMEWLLALHRRLHEDDAAMSAGVNTGNEPLAALAATTTAEHAHHHMVRPDRLSLPDAANMGAFRSRGSWTR